MRRGQRLQNAPTSSESGKEGWQQTHPSRDREGVVQHGWKFGLAGGKPLRFMPQWLGENQWVMDTVCRFLTGAARLVSVEFTG